MTADLLVFVAVASVLVAWLLSLVVRDKWTARRRPRRNGNRRRR